MSFYLASLEAARHQHRMMEAAAAHAHSHLPRPQHHPPVPLPLHAGTSSSGSATGATAREEAGDGAGEEVRSKRPLEPPTPRTRSPPLPPKRRAVAAVSARRLSQPGCGRDDAAPPLASAHDGDASRCLTPRGHGGGGGPGAPHKLALAPPRRPALAGAKVDSVLFEAASSPSFGAAAGGASISALGKVSASSGAAGVTANDGGQHFQGKGLEKSSEAWGRNGAPAATAAGALMDAADSQGVAGPMVAIRLLPKPTTVSANRRFPPGCRRLGASLPAGDGTTNQVVCLPSPGEVVAPAERDDMEFVARPGSHFSSSVTLPEATACGHDASVPARAHGVSVPAISSSGERIGNRWHCQQMSSSAVPASGANVTNKPDGSSCNVVAETSAQGLSSKYGHRSESVSEYPDDFADAVSGERAVVTTKVMHTPRKSVRPPRLIQKTLLDTQCRPFSIEIERKTELVGQSVSMNDAEDTGVFTKDGAIQDPMSANKPTWTNGKEAAFFGPKKRVKKKKLNKRRFTVKGPAHPPINAASGSALGSTEKLEDDEIFKALAADETKFEYVPQNADARSKVKLICTRFESICRAIVQAAGHRSVKVRRIDLAADKLTRKLPGFTKQGPVVGSVPGVQVGDQFLYRVQLALVGLHRPFQGGIDATWHETGVRIAISVVASGGYPDELSSCSGELVYTGSGHKGNGDQKLEHGNLALMNCIEMKTPVREIHGFKDQNREEFGSHWRAREISTFTYDGLYHVVDCWREGSPGSKVFKYKLRRIPGQPQLSLHMAKGFLVKNSMRPGFIFA